MQLEGRVNDIQQTLQQDVQISSSDSSTSDSDIDDRLVAMRKRREARASEHAELRDAIQEQIDALQAQQEAAQAEQNAAQAEIDRLQQAADQEEVAYQELQAQVARAFSFVIGWALLAWYASGLVN